MFQPSPTSAQGLYRSTFLLYIALLLGQIVFCFVVVFLITQPDRGLKEGSAYPFLGALIVCLAFGGAWWMNRLRQASIKRLRANFPGKILHYRTSVIVRVAMLEAGNLFCLVIALLEGTLFPLLFFCVGLAFFLYFRPNKDEVTRWYQLKDEEARQLYLR
ncbi:MAG: hypothetical protein AAGJ82_11440 [Bacteroidota bacterium]